MLDFNNYINPVNNGTEKLKHLWKIENLRLFRNFREDAIDELNLGDNPLANYIFDMAWNDTAVMDAAPLHERCEKVFDTLRIYAQIICIPTTQEILEQTRSKDNNIDTTYVIELENSTKITVNVHGAVPNATGTIESNLQDYESLDDLSPGKFILVIAAIDNTLELVLQHAIAGVDITASDYKAGLYVALEGIMGELT